MCDGKRLTPSFPGKRGRNVTALRAALPDVVPTALRPRGSRSCASDPRRRVLDRGPPAHGSTAAQDRWGCRPRRPPVLSRTVLGNLFWYHLSNFLWPHPVVWQLDLAPPLAWEFFSSMRLLLGAGGARTSYSGGAQRSSQDHPNHHRSVWGHARARQRTFREVRPERSAVPWPTSQKVPLFRDRYAGTGDCSATSVDGTCHAFRGPLVAAGQSASFRTMIGLHQPDAAQPMAGSSRDHRVGVTANHRSHEPWPRGGPRGHGVERCCRSGGSVHSSRPHDGKRASERRSPLLSSHAPGPHREQTRPGRHRTPPWPCRASCRRAGAGPEVSVGEAPRATGPGCPSGRERSVVPPRWRVERSVISGPERALFRPDRSGPFRGRSVWRVGGAPGLAIAVPRPGCGAAAVARFGS
jgi:hypothetical protein